MRRSRADRADPPTRPSACAADARRSRRPSPTSRARTPSRMRSPRSVVNFLRILHNLKTTKRTGWVRKGIKQPESIADHMYRMGLMALIADDSNVDRNKCIKCVHSRKARARVRAARRPHPDKTTALTPRSRARSHIPGGRMALVHDIAEAIAGDIAPSDGIPKEEKHRLERNALASICGELTVGSDGAAPSGVATEIRDLWFEYEDGSSDEARLVKDIDKVNRARASDPSPPFSAIASRVIPALRMLTRRAPHIHLACSLPLRCCLHAIPLFLASSPSPLPFSPTPTQP